MQWVLTEWAGQDRTGQVRPSIDFPMLRSGFSHRSVTTAICYETSIKLKSQPNRPRFRFSKTWRRDFGFCDGGNLTQVGIVSVFPACAEYIV